MNKKIYFFFGLLLAGICIITINIKSSQEFANSEASFSTFFQLAGKAPKAASKVMSSIVPVDSIDEGKLGSEIKTRLEELQRFEEQIRTTEYLNSIIRDITWKKNKKFEYKIFLDPSSIPNAMAMPGGVVIVTQGLMNILRSESELVAILGHEIGHIELSHCFDTVKYQLLSEKILNASIGQVADIARNILLRHSFSKTQEDEADTYAFQFLVNSSYDPAALSRSFMILKTATSSYGYEDRSDILSDYFNSHPLIDHRITKSASLAKAWWKQHPNEKRYVGEKNLKELRRADYGEEEWVSDYWTHTPQTF